MRVHPAFPMARERFRGSSSSTTKEALTTFCIFRLRLRAPVTPLWLPIRITVMALTARYPAPTQVPAGRSVITDVNATVDRLRQTAQIAEGETACLFRRDSSQTVRLDLAFEVVAELLGDLAVNPAATEKPAQRRDETRDHRPSRRMRRIDSANASQVAVSVFKRFRPAGVIV